MANWRGEWKKRLRNKERECRMLVFCLLSTTHVVLWGGFSKRKRGN